MRYWTISFSIIIALALLVGVGYFGLGWFHPSHSTISEIAAGFDAESEPATLKEAMAVAHDALDALEQNVHDYSAVIIKRERIGKDLAETVMFCKIREEPFSVYLHFLDRSNDKGVKGREVLFVQGQNGDKLLGHTPGFIAGRFTVSLDPKGPIAMLGERYPIMEIGLANLCRQLIKRGEAVDDPSQVQVKRFPHARINARACYLLEITYPVRESKVWGYLARVFVDNQFRIPIRVEVHELPLDRSAGPQLVEEYTYLDLKLNNGYTDADFSPKNPQYKFP
jgi:hypothetical protein